MAEVYDDLAPIEDLINQVAAELKHPDLAPLWVKSLQDNLYRDVGELKHITLEECLALRLPVAMVRRVKTILQVPDRRLEGDGQQDDDVSFTGAAMTAMLEDSKFDEFSNIFDAASRGDTNAVLTMLSNGATSVHDTNDIHWTPLHFAAFFGHIDVTRLLLEHRADVNSEDRSMSTPLHCAAIGGHDQVAELLLVHGAHAAACNTCKRTPLDIATYTNKPRVAAIIKKFSDTSDLGVSEW
mmetsp:Transcript_21308/g.50064  ORF Transcript_21308/g.50064 Transcript_21308/m.50064 type:complete len:240 (-) Transcript_21308:326-1045(-)